MNVTTILFDDEVDIIHDRFPVEIIESLTDKEYFVRGCTALLDAVGTAIEKMENVQKHLPEDHRAGKIIFVITTDGLENSSEHFTQEQIRRKIEAKKECGWEFLFLGANIDVGREAEKIGIARNRSVTYENDSKGVELNFKAVGRAISKAVECIAMMDFMETIGQMRFRHIKRAKNNQNSFWAFLHNYFAFAKILFVIKLNKTSPYDIIQKIKYVKIFETKYT